MESNSSTNDTTFFALFDGSNIQVTSNKTNDTVNADDDDQGSAIFIGAGPGVLVEDNTLNRPAVSGIAVRGTAQNVDLLGNTINDAEKHGIDVTANAPGAAEIRNNKSLDNDVDGIFMGIDTNGNTLQNNTAKSNGDFDCEDDSIGSNTAGTANFWATSNVGPKDSPNGLCKRRR